MCDDRTEVFIDELFSSPLKAWQRDLIIWALKDEYIYEYGEKKSILAREIDIHRDRINELIDNNYRYHNINFNDPRRIETLRTICLFLMQPTHDRDRKRLCEEHFATEDISHLLPQTLT